MNKSICLGKIFGIEFRIHYTWFIIFVLITMFLSIYYTRNYQDWSAVARWAVGLITSLLFFASILAHELAHSVVAIKHGIPVKSITLFIFGGIARIAKEATSPLTEFKVAIAGPLCSLSLATFFGFIWFSTKDVVELVGAMTGYLALINAMVTAFNMIPGFPLDGGRVFRSLIWRITGNYFRASQIAHIGGKVVACAFIGGGIISIPILWFSEQVILFDGIWFALIGWFLYTATGASYRQVKLHQSLQGLRVREVMFRDCPVVSREMALSQLAEDRLLYIGHGCFLVGGEGKFEGVLNLDDLRKVPRERWDITTVTRVMTPIGRLSLARPDDDLITVLNRLVESGTNQMPVVHEGGVIGLISKDELLRLAQMRSKLKL